MKHLIIAPFIIAVACLLVHDYLDEKKITRQAMEIKTLENKVWDLETKIHTDSIIHYNEAVFRKGLDSVFSVHQLK